MLTSSLRHPPLPSFFLSVNTSGGEHKKGRVSELEGQQQASGRAMFLLSGPQREGGRKAGKEYEEEEERSSLFLMWLAREMVRAERFFSHPRLASAFLPLRRAIQWSRCHVILARKENRGGKEQRRVDFKTLNLGFTCKTSTKMQI